MAGRRTSTFKPAASPSYAVERQALVDSISSAVAHRVTVVLAPAGYGKSVAVSQWTMACDQPVAWMSLTSADNDETAFGARLAAALQSLGPGVRVRLAEGGTPGLGRKAGRSTEHIGSHLEMTTQGVLVLDEFDALTDDHVLRAFGRYLDAAPPELHVVVITRRQPQLELHRLRLQNEVAEIRAPDLAFDAQSAQELVERVADRTLTATQVQILLATTQGWAGALRYAALLLVDPDADIDEIVADAPHRNPDIAAYLTGEVLDQLTPELHAFLIDTSVLDVVNASLADATAQRTDSMRMLEALEQREAFITSVDAGREWFSYHPMLRGLLRHQLHAQDPDRENALLQRAAEWYRERGDPERAAEYFIAKQNWPAVIDLVAAAGRAMFERGKSADALRWMEAVPQSIRRSSVDVTLQEAALDTMAGRTLTAARIVSVLERERDLSLGQRAAVEAMKAAWVMYHASPESALEATDSFSRILDQLGAVAAGERDRRVGDHSKYVPDMFGLGTPRDLAMQAGVCRACALWYLGDTNTARRDLRALVGDPASYVPWLVNGLSLLALIEAIDGQLQAAEHYAERAFTAGGEAKLGWHPSTIHAHLALAHAHRERNELPEANLALARIRGFAGQYRRMAAQAIGTAEEGLVHLALGDPVLGLEYLARFRTSGGVAPVGLVSDVLAAAKGQLLIAAGNTSEALVVAEPKEVSLPMVRAVAIQAAVVAEDVPLARKLFYDWLTSEESTRGERLLRELSAGLVDDLDGNRRSALDHMRSALTLGEADGLVRTFLDAGPRAVRLLRSIFNREPRPYVRTLLEQYRVVQHVPSKYGRPIVPLTERELGVLPYLPTRLTNAEIAERLYVSSNTLKTHLRSIYRKMGVTGRREAVEMAELAGLA